MVTGEFMFWSRVFFYGVEFMLLSGTFVLVSSWCYGMEPKL